MRSSTKKPTTGRTKKSARARPHDLQKPPLPEPPLPPGVNHTSPVPQGVEFKAQKLVREAGSPDAAKQAVDAAVAKERASDFREDHFAVRCGFTSRGSLYAASRPIQAADGSDWWATELPNQRWVVWNQDDLTARDQFASLAEARQAINTTH